MNKNSYPLIINETIITIYRLVLVPYINSFKNFLSPLQFLTLCIIDRNKESTITSLSNSMNMPKQNMTKIITKLEELELVQKKQNSIDKRITNIYVTEKALTFMRENSLDNSNRMCKFLSNLSDEELNEFYTSLTKINNVLSKLEENHF
ncbi:MAG: MarR family transcriptional regulator [Clostridium sp.]|nr:MarR family transcriptional regulator [Clostridium sp.]MDY3828311.1 MarR family transcriptional regulator [Clostridium sp.]